MFWYVLSHYAKNMLIILFSLSMLFTGLDFLIGATHLPSFNIKVLYIFNRWQESLNLLYPLAIIFGGIWTKIYFIKSNTLGALYALGISRVQIFFPFFILSLFTYFLFVALNFTSFATASDIANSIKKSEYNRGGSEEIFFKYNSSFAYINRLLPKERRLEGLTIFILEGDSVVEVQEAKEANYVNSEWIAHDVNIKRVVTDGSKRRLEFEHLDTLRTLKNYNPKILNSIYENKRLTLYESLIAKNLLSTQGIGTYKVRADVYNRIVTPLFSIALLMILIFRFPFHARYINIVSVTTKALGGTLFIWGILFASYRMGLNGVVSPELAMVLPIVVLWVYAIYTLRGAERRV